MPHKFNNFVRGYVLGLSKGNLSFADMIRICKENNTIISTHGTYGNWNDKYGLD